MPIFDNQAPPEPSSAGYRLIRTPPAHALLAHVLSDNLVGCKTHFIGNRTVPCEAPECDPCQNGVAWRWHGYLAIVIDATQEIAIFECTARASAAFADYFERYGTTRGAHFKAQRLNARPNGRVLIQAKPCDLAKLHLPTAPRVENMLCHVWNIPETQIKHGEQRQRPPFPNVQVTRDAPNRLEALSKDQLPQQPTTPTAGNGRKTANP